MTIKKYQQKPNVKLGENVKAELDEIGSKGDTYEDIIQMLIKFYKEVKNGRQKNSRKS